jgi:hypothetical protein
LIWFRRFIHHFLPQSLQENMIILARKKWLYENINA